MLDLFAKKTSKISPEKYKRHILFLNKKISVMNSQFPLKQLITKKNGFDRLGYNFFLLV